MSNLSTFLGLTQLLVLDTDLLIHVLSFFTSVPLPEVTWGHFSLPQEACRRNNTIFPQIRPNACIFSENEKLSTSLKGQKGSENKVNLIFDRVSIINVIIKLGRLDTSLNSLNPPHQSLSIRGFVSF